MPPLHRNRPGRDPAPLFWVDVDDTILDFTGAHPAGVRGVERWARGHTDSARAARVAEHFDLAFQASLHVWHAGESSGPMATLQRRVEHRMDRVVAEGRFPRRWAREVWLELALEDCGAWLEREVIATGSDAYWQALAPAQRLYPGVKETLTELTARGYRVVLLTSSDGRLLPDAGQWRYETEASRDWKLRRLREVLAPVLAHVERMIIGDPFEKSGPEFFQNALDQLAPEPGGAVFALGDSHESDILFARRADARVSLGVLCDPHRRYPPGKRDGVDLQVQELPSVLPYFF